MAAGWHHSDVIRTPKKEEKVKTNLSATQSLGWQIAGLAISRVKKGVLTHGNVKDRRYTSPHLGRGGIPRRISSGGDIGPAVLADVFGVTDQEERLRVCVHFPENGDVRGQHVDVRGIKSFRWKIENGMIVLIDFDHLIDSEGGAL